MGKILVLKVDAKSQIFISTTCSCKRLLRVLDTVKTFTCVCGKVYEVSEI